MDAIVPVLVLVFICGMFAKTITYIYDYRVHPHHDRQHRSVHHPRR